MTLQFQIGKVEHRIHVIRGRKVMLDWELAALYGVATGRFNEQVTRNIERFPEDFMFQLTRQEFEGLISQSAISNPGRGGRRKLPRAFTQEGVAMLSGVLRSARAIRVNVAIMRTFVKLREMASAHKEIAARLDELEQKVEGQDARIEDVFRAIRELTLHEKKRTLRIGFQP